MPALKVGSVHHGRNESMLRLLKTFSFLSEFRSKPRLLTTHEARMSQ
jgi:hypothetical protein